MRRLLLPIFTLAFSSSAYAQVLSWSDVDQDQTCHFTDITVTDGEIIPVDSRTLARINDPVIIRQAEEIRIRVDNLTKIAKFINLNNNFHVGLSDHGSASAAIVKNKPMIIVDYEWMNWSDSNKMVILAHEMAHHMLGHTLNKSGTRSQKELDADRLAGQLVARWVRYEHKLSAGPWKYQNIDADKIYTQYEYAYYGLPSKATNTHPEPINRLESFEHGWHEGALITNNTYNFKF